MYNLADIVSTGYQTGAKIGQDITAGNILQEAYKGVDAADPQAAVTINQKAAQLAGMTGNASLAHTFQKEASEVGKGAAEQQLNQLKTTQGKLELASQFAGAANNEDDLRKAYQVAGVGTQEAQIMEGILRNPNVPFERKKEEFKRMGLTANQDIQAQLKVLQGQLNERKVEVLEQGLLLRERKAAQGQGNLKPAKGFEVKGTESVLKSTYGKDMINDMSDEDWTAAATRVEARARQIAKDQDIDLTDAKDMAAEELFKPTSKSTWGGLSSKEGYEFQKPTTSAPAATKEAKKESSKNKEESFKARDGQTYNKPAGWSAAKWQAYKDANK